MYVRGLVAGNVVGLVHQVGGVDGRLAEAQVGYRKAAGLLGVVSEVGLSVEIGVVPDDLDGLLVCAHGAVGAEAEELALYSAGSHGVVGDAHGEVVLGADGGHVGENGFSHGGREFLGTQTVAAAEDFRRLALFHEGGANVEVQRLAEAAGFLGTIEDGDGLHRGRDDLQEVFGGEGTEQADLHEADALALGVQQVDDFLDGFAGGAHGHNDTVGFRMAHVVEGTVFAAGDALDLLHRFDNDVRDRIIEEVPAFGVLEVDVGVLGRAALMGVFRIHGVLPEFVHLVPIDDLADVFIVDDFDLLDFMGGTETVEEMAEGDAGFDGGQMGNQGDVHAFLDGAGAKESKTGLARGHHVLLVAEDAQRVRGKGTGGNVEYGGKQFTGDFVHVGDHQQEALRSRKRAGHGTSHQGTVHGTGGTGFGLQFTYGDGLAHQVFLAGGGPVVSEFAHHGRRRDRINTSDIAESIRDMRGCRVAVHGFHFLSHEDSLPPPGGLCLSCLQEA